VFYRLSAACNLHVRYIWIHNVQPYCVCEECDFFSQSKRSTVTIAKWMEAQWTFADLFPSISVLGTHWNRLFGILLRWSSMRALGSVLVFWAILATTLSGQAQQKSQTAPNIFLVTIDTLRADHILCYGYEHIKTPALDSLARDGIRFAQAFTPSPITNTSHTSILTGLLPSTHGVTDFAVPLAAQNKTLAEELKSRGYVTAAFIGSVILDSKDFAPGLDRGFDFYDNFPHPARTKSRWGRLERRAEDVTQHADAWLNAHPTPPHFVWIHLYDPHDPYEPPPPYSQIYKDNLYDGEIAYADSALAGFVASLKKRGWYEHSIIVVLADHGEGLGEHHEQTHGIFLYDSTTHVPLIIKLPDERVSASVVNSQVRTVDVFPTILDLLHIPAPERLDGDSLRPYFSGSEHADKEKEKDRIVLGETDYPLRFGWAPLRSIRADRFKFIDAPRPELYDLNRDPHEQTNDYQPWDANVQKFRALLADRRGKTGSSSAAGSIPQNTLDELKALGYLTRADAATSSNLTEPSLLPDPKDKIEEQNLLHRAMIASEDERSNEARVALEKVVDLDPESAEALSQLGELELQTGEFAKAAHHLALARRLHPDDPTVAFDEGRARESVGDFPAAKEALDACLKLDPSHLSARLLHGDVELRLKNLKAAEDDFEAALLLDPQNPRARVGMAKVQLASGRFREAAKQLEPMATRQSGNAEVFDVLAQSYAALGEKAKAEQAEKRAKTIRGSKRP
jgi:arylsulfatase A-like enzyme/cytochrome c-type biogenesis protein CcmH/NrfG